MKIGVISPYPEFGKLASEIGAEMNLDIFVKKGALEFGIRAAQELQDDGVEAIVTRAPTAELVKKNVDLPVIPLDVTDFDLIRALRHAQKKGSTVAFVDYHPEGYNTTYNFDAVQEIFDHHVERFSFTDYSDVKSCVRRARDSGIELIVATCECVIKESAKLNIDNILVYTSREDFIRAFNTAISTIEVQRKEAEKAKWSTTILENTIEGIISIDGAGKVQVFNNAAERITGIAAKELIGKDISAACRDYAIFEKVYEHSDEVIDVNNAKIAIKRFPIGMGPSFRGLIINLRRISEERGLTSKVLQNGLIARATFSDIAGKSIAITGLKAKAARYSNYSSTILICGESGTGKELFAQSIHNASPLSKGPFLAVNCAALPESLLESELFGYEEGAFTGAKKGGKKGLFELAQGGTIFLDEISEMTLSLQACLLRVLQQKEVIRLGGQTVIPIETRVICATNRDLAETVKKGGFREDLYYRINVLTLEVSPLRKRPEDIPVIARALVHKASLKLGKSAYVSSELLQELTQYDWPGNIRELETFIERLLISIDGPEVTKETFWPIFEEIMGMDQEYQFVSKPSINEQLSIRLTNMKDMEQQIISQVLDLVQGDQEKLSRLLGVSRTTLWRRLKVGS